MHAALERIYPEPHLVHAVLLVHSVQPGEQASHRLFEIKYPGSQLEQTPLEHVLQVFWQALAQIPLLKAYPDLQVVQEVLVHTEHPSVQATQALDDK